MTRGVEKLRNLLSWSCAIVKFAITSLFPRLKKNHLSRRAGRKKEDRARLRYVNICLAGHGEAFCILCGDYTRRRARKTRCTLAGGIGFVFCFFLISLSATSKSFSFANSQQVKTVTHLDDIVERLDRLGLSLINFL